MSLWNSLPYFGTTAMTCGHLQCGPSTLPGRSEVCGKHGDPCGGRRVPFKLQTNTGALRNIERMHQMPSAPYLLCRCHIQPRLCMGHLGSEFNNLIGPPASLPPVQPLYTSCPELTSIHTEIPGGRKKVILPDAALRSLVTTHLEEEFSDHLLLFTDALVNHIRNSATAAATLLH